MTLSHKRSALRHLLDIDDPADAQAYYYAFHHPDEKVELITTPVASRRAAGYICLARTGADLFRPVLSLRLPKDRSGEKIDLERSATLIDSALPPGAAVIGSTPIAYAPLINAMFEVSSEEKVRLYRLERHRFRPVINVLITAGESFNGLPRFVIRSLPERKSNSVGEVVASAGLNWQSDQFAEIYVHTAPTKRRQGYGRSIVAAAIQHVLDSGRTPLYQVNDTNLASIELAEGIGFVDTGRDQYHFEGQRAHQG